MLLTISTTHKDACGLSYLLHKSPEFCHKVPLNFGTAHVFYPEFKDETCTAALLLDIDPIEMIRTKKSSSITIPLEQYVNDRPYVASSFLSVALVAAFGSAMNGKCKNRPELVSQVWPLTVKLSVVLAKGGQQVLKNLFEPLGYELKITEFLLDERFTEWGISYYYTVELKNNITVQNLLRHLYVLIPVLDHQKHYFVDKQEIEKLLSKGKGWLEAHPQREFIAQRFLKFQRSLAREAVERLEETNPVAEDIADDSVIASEETIEAKMNLNQERHNTVLAVLKNINAEKVLDLGCAEGRFVGLLLKERQFKKIVGMDVSIRSLEMATERLRFERMAPKQKERVQLLHGSLMYRDKRLEGFDAATVIEVIEHLDPPRLAAFERVLFEYAKPKAIVLTTPNAEYNVLWENLGAGKFRHQDHRFEWTRKEFEAWAQKVAQKFKYHVRLAPVGPLHAELGSPTQMAIFTE